MLGQLGWAALERQLNKVQDVASPVVRGGRPQKQAGPSLMKVNDPPALH